MGRDGATGKKLKAADVLAAMLTLGRMAGHNAYQPARSRVQQLIANPHGAKRRNKRRRALLKQKGYSKHHSRARKRRRAK